jgi:Ca-activated chloride channel family protein
MPLMHFGDLPLLWLLALVPALALFFAWALWRKTAVLRRFAESEMLRRLVAGTSLFRQAAKMILILLVVTLLSLSLARPQWGTKTETVQRKGLDVVVAVDVSLSMYAEDIKPNRLARSKQEIQRFADRLQGDRVALVAFAGDAFLQCPLTSDYSAFRIFLDVLDPTLIDAPGTDVARALQASLKAFPEPGKAGAAASRVIILITDGEDHSGRALKVAQEAAGQGVVVYTVGLGSVSGVPIPVRDENGVKSYKKDLRGNVVSTRMDPKLLQEIARATKGEFYHAQPGHFELLDVLERINSMEKKEQDSQKFSRFEDRFQIPLAAALFFLVAEMLLSDRRRRRQAWSGRFS